ncbi:MAG: hypothetical protein HYU75_13855 [Betaproteobacteria bacterium]|nr:hypothetical protein [Betaproteobacteria bacterium]
MNILPSDSRDRRDDDFSKASPSKASTSLKGTIAGIATYLLTPFLAFGLLLALMRLLNIY